MGTSDPCDPKRRKQVKMMDGWKFRENFKWFLLIWSTRIFFTWQCCLWKLIKSIVTSLASLYDVQVNHPVSLQAFQAELFSLWKYTQILVLDKRILCGMLICDVLSMTVIIIKVTRCKPLWECVRERGAFLCRNLFERKKKTKTRDEDSREQIIGIKPDASGLHRNSTHFALFHLLLYFYFCRSRIT